MLKVHTKCVITNGRICDKAVFKIDKENLDYYSLKSVKGSKHSQDIPSSLARHIHMYSFIVGLENSCRGIFPALKQFYYMIACPERLI